MTKIDEVKNRLEISPSMFRIRNQFEDELAAILSRQQLFVPIAVIFQCKKNSLLLFTIVSDTNHKMVYPDNLKQHIEDWRQFDIPHLQNQKIPHLQNQKIP